MGTNVGGLKRNQTKTSLPSEEGRTEAVLADQQTAHRRELVEAPNKTDLNQTDRDKRERERRER